MATVASFAPESDTNSPRPPGSSLERMENLVKHTVNYAPEEVERLLREQFLEMRRRKVCLQETQQFARALIGNVLEKLTELDLRLEEIYTDPAGIILTICTSQSNSEIMDRVHVFLNTVGAMPGNIAARRPISSRSLSGSISKKTTWIPNSLRARLPRVCISMRHMSRRCSVPPAARP